MSHAPLSPLHFCANSLLYDALNYTIVVYLHYTFVHSCYTFSTPTFATTPSFCYTGGHSWPTAYLYNCILLVVYATHQMKLGAIHAQMYIIDDFYLLSSQL